MYHKGKFIFVFLALLIFFLKKHSQTLLGPQQTSIL
jgi:hypothetical protein